MNTIEENQVIDRQLQSDNEAAARYFVEGKPFPPDLVLRIRSRAARIREETFQRMGEVDIDKLIHEARDGA